MNSTDDGQPVGEFSDLVRAWNAYAVQVGREAVAKWSGLSMPAACDQIDRQAEALDKIRARVHEALKCPRSQAYSEHVLQEIATIVRDVRPQT